MNDSKLSLTDYSLACFQCGQQDTVSLIPQRNSDDHVVGIFALCKKCYTIFGGGTVKTEFVKPSKSKEEAEISASSNKSSVEMPTLEECQKELLGLHGIQGYRVDEAYEEMYNLIVRHITR